MKLIEKLKEYENQYMFVHWAMGGEYGKLISVGDDYIEFNKILITLTTTENQKINEGRKSSRTEKSV